MKDKQPTLLTSSKPFFEGKKHITQLVFLCLMAMAFAIIFGCFGTLVANGIYGSDVESAGKYRVLLTINSIGTFLLPALLFAFCQDRKCFHYNHSDHIAGNFPGIVAVIILSITILPIAGVLVELNKMIQLPDSMAKLTEIMRQMQESSDNVLAVITAEHNIGILLLNLLICAALPAICEEFFFRGTLQQLLHSWFHNKHVAVWLGGFIFSVIHFQMDGLFARWLLGAYLGYLFVWSGTLWLPILAHFLHNALSILIQYIIDVLGIQPNSGFDQLSIIATILSIVFCAALLFLTYKSYQIKEEKNDLA